MICFDVLYNDEKTISHSLVCFLLDQEETSQDRDNQTQEKSSWLQRMEEKDYYQSLFTELLVI